MQALKQIDLSPSSRRLCGHDLRRPHLTCLYCRIRRMHHGKMPRAIEVQVYYIAIQRIPPRRFALAKDVLFRRLMNLAELLAT